MLIDEFEREEQLQQQGQKTTSIPRVEDGMEMQTEDDEMWTIVRELEEQEQETERQRRANGVNNDKNEEKKVEMSKEESKPQQPQQPQEDSDDDLYVND